MNYALSHDAEAIRGRRRALAKSQKVDPLEERARKIAFWKECAKTNRAYVPHNGAWWFSMTFQAWGRPLLMPRLAARLDARDRTHQEAYRSELRAQSIAWQKKKAERAAEKARAKRDITTGQQSLLTSEAAC